jgi:hypothetical protein
LSALHRLAFKRCFQESVRGDEGHGWEDSRSVARKARDTWSRWDESKKRGGISRATWRLCVERFPLRIRDSTSRWHKHHFYSTGDYHRCILPGALIIEQEHAWRPRPHFQLIRCMHLEKKI